MWVLWILWPELGKASRGLSLSYMPGNWESILVSRNVTRPPLAHCGPWLHLGKQRCHGVAEMPWGHRRDDMRSYWALTVEQAW